MPAASACRRPPAAARRCSRVPPHRRTARRARSLLARRRFKGLFWKFARVGERLSPWVAVACFCMAFSVVFL